VRQTRPVNSDIDGVGITAILQPPTGPPLILLQKQFRPPVDKVCIEIPAGLIDEGETAEECALRELKEETGYVGKVVSGSFGVGPVIFNGELAFFLFLYLGFGAALGTEG
jgi:ADP-ribose pyrophosphatase